MASNLRVDSIVPATGTNVSIGTATGGVNIPGDLGIAGTLTYEDVTNIDSVGVITARTDINIGDSIIHIGDTNTKIRFPAADTITAETGGSERLRILSDGKVLIGTSNVPSNKNTVTPSLNVSGSGVLGAAQITRHTSVGGGGALLHLAGTRGSDINSYTILQSGDGIGTLAFNAADGNEFVTAAEISAQVDGTPGDNDMPGRLVFKTTADGASSSTERLRIDSSGNITTPYQPSFTARSSGTWTHGSNTGYLDIDINMIELFDIGGNYNHSTGVFTAPVAGKYFFSYTFQYKCTSGYLVVTLRKGVSGTYSQYGNMVVYPQQQSTVYTGPGIVGVMDLAAGNTVKPNAEVNYAGNQIANVNFSGYLLG